MTRVFTILTITLFAAALMACDTSTVQDDAVEIQSSLNQDFGGLSAEDEDPMHGDEETFEDLGEAEEDPAEELTPDEPAVDDAIGDAQDPSIATAERPTVYAVAVTWGRRVLDTTAEEPVIWNPTLSTDCGVIGMRRRIRLEPLEGVVRPRESAQSITFRSATLPHFDGALVVLVVPADQAACAEAGGMLRFNSDALDEELTVPLDPNMANLVLRHELGDGNEVIAIGHEIEPPNDGCVHGFVVGRWVSAIDATGQVKGQLGRFYGRVMGPLGGLRGHIKGIYGKPEQGDHAGKQVLFGKYINPEGEFRGILAGRYGLGLLAGGWHLRPVADPAELKGLFIGQYASMPAIVPDGGLFRMAYGSVECLNIPDAEPVE